MLSGVFKDRSKDCRRKDRGAKERAATEEQALAGLLTARELRSFTLTRHCEIGPFVVEYLFPESSLILELAASDVQSVATARRQAARLKFFNDMGYIVLTLEPRELTRHPRRVLARLLAALRS